jgi:hypothetical protein
MFPFPTPTNQLLQVENAIKESKSKAKRENDDKMVFRSSPKVHPPSSSSSTSSYSHQSEFTLNAIDKMLETEKNNNKTESWNKLNKTVKTQKLYTFAEKYGKEHGVPIKDIKALKQFFLDCLEKNKLSKTKDLVYDKETNEITSIPSLMYQSSSHHFTLKNIDPKRVSTLKALNPKALTRIKESRIIDDALLLKQTEESDRNNVVDGPEEESSEV